MKWNGFNFKNLRSGVDKNTTDYPEILVNVTSYPLFASDRVRKVYPIAADGSYTKVDGKQDKSATANVKFISKNRYEKMKAMREIALWLNGPGEMYFNMDASILYQAQLLNEIPIAKAFELDEFDVVFDLKPISSANWPLGLRVDSPVPVDSEIPVDGFTSSISVTGSDSLVLQNNGTYKTYPVIKLDGTADEVNLVWDGKTITYTSLSGIAYIDTLHYEAYDDADASLIDNVEGLDENFLKVGETTVTITGTNMNLDVTFDYVFKYL